MKQVGFKPGVKVRGMDEQSGESKEGEVIGEGIGESEGLYSSQRRQQPSIQWCYF